MKRYLLPLVVLLMLLTLAAQCAPPQVVEKEVIKEVEKEVVVTATPAPMEAGEDTGRVFILGPFRGSEETAFNNVIAVFEEQNPDIDVIYSGTAEFETLITVRVEAGDTRRRVLGWIRSPFRMDATTRRSSSRALVQDPTKTWSTRLRFVFAQP